MKTKNDLQKLNATNLDNPEGLGYWLIIVCALTIVLFGQQAKYLWSGENLFLGTFQAAQL